MRIKPALACLAAVVLAAAVPAVARAHAAPAPAAVGGFIDYEVNVKHLRHGLSSFSLPSVYYTRSGDAEEFGLRTGASNRVEHDTDTHYNGGRHEFHGDLQVFPGISQQSVVQVFGGGKGGPILMIKAYGRNGGSLVVTRDTAQDLVTHCFGAGKIRVEIAHDVKAHLLAVSIDGTRRWSGADAGAAYTGSYNVKYGLYGSFNAPTHTVWSGVRLTG
jgi:hypothetical protein